MSRSGNKLGLSMMLAINHSVGPADVEKRDPMAEVYRQEWQ